MWTWPHSRLSVINWPGIWFLFRRKQEFDLSQWQNGGATIWFENNSIFNEYFVYYLSHLFLSPLITCPTNITYIFDTLPNSLQNITNNFLSSFSLFNLQISPSDGLSTIVCQICRIQLESCQQFREKAQRSQQKLQNFLQFAHKLNGNPQVSHLARAKLYTEQNSQQKI